MSASRQWFQLHGFKAFNRYCLEFDTFVQNNYIFTCAPWCRYTWFSRNTQHATRNTNMSIFFFSPFFFSFFFPFSSFFFFFFLLFILPFFFSFIFSFSFFFPPLLFYCFPSLVLSIYPFLSFFPFFKFSIFNSLSSFFIFQPPPCNVIFFSIYQHLIYFIPTSIYKTLLSLSLYISHILNLSYQFFKEFIHSFLLFSLFLPYFIESLLPS